LLPDSKKHAVPDPEHVPVVAWEMNFQKTILDRRATNDHCTESKTWNQGEP
jgi:hypothetical protein